MDIAVLLKGYLLVCLLALLGRMMIGVAEVLKKKIAGGSVAAAAVPAVVLTLCALVVDGITLARRPSLADEPWTWFTAIFIAVGALQGWMKFFEVQRRQPAQGKSAERTLR